MSDKKKLITAKSGWHTIAGYDIHVANGFVDHAIKLHWSGYFYEEACFFIPTKDGRDWEYWSMKSHPLTLKQVKDRIYRGTMKVF